MTMHIDEALLGKVMEDYGFTNKTEAVHAALNEMDRRVRLKAFAEKGLGLTPDELGDAVDENYDLMALRVAETPPNYGSSGSR